MVPPSSSGTPAENTRQGFHDVGLSLTLDPSTAQLLGSDIYNTKTLHLGPHPTDFGSRSLPISCPFLFWTCPWSGRMARGIGSPFFNFPMSSRIHGTVQFGAVHMSNTSADPVDVRVPPLTIHCLPRRISNRLQPFPLRETRYPGRSNSWTNGASHIFSRNIYELIHHRDCGFGSIAMVMISLMSPSCPPTEDYSLCIHRSPLLYHAHTWQPSCSIL